MDHGQIVMNKVLHNIALEDFSNVVNEQEEKIFVKYNMIGNRMAKMHIRNVNIVCNENHPSDDYIYEYFVGDEMVAFMYARRNDINIIDLYISYFK